MSGYQRARVILIAIAATLGVILISQLYALVTHDIQEVASVIERATSGSISCYEDMDCWDWRTMGNHLGFFEGLLHRWFGFTLWTAT